MIIKSNFRDYYDVVQKEAFSNDIRYIRYPKEVYPAPFNLELIGNVHRHFYSRTNDYACDSWVVGFCGKLYPVVCLEKADSVGRYFTPTDKSVFCFNIEDVDNFFRNSNFSEKVVNHYFEGDRNKWLRRFLDPAKRVYFKDFFVEVEKAENKIKDHFYESREPIFVYKCVYRKIHKNGKDYSDWVDILTYNDNLNKLDFYRRLDPYTAFQEIQMFLGNLASPEKEIPEIDDKTMSEIKGFDKWSFRKEPQKKKQKR